MTAGQRQVFLVSTLTELERADDEQDRSLLYTFDLSGAESAACVNTFKGLSLAVRGVLSSICGEQTRTIRLRQQDSGDGLVLAQAHLQACILVLVLPGHLSDRLAHGLVKLLSQTLKLLAGPSNGWLMPDLTAGSAQPLVLKKDFRVLLDKASHGVLQQLEGPGWLQCLPCLTLEVALLYLPLPQEVQAVLSRTMLHFQQTGAVLVADSSAEAVPIPSSLPLPQHHVSMAEMPPGMMTAQPAGCSFQFFRRRCCLMTRGIMLFSGMPAADTKRVWQLCWVLQCAAAAAQPGACQVLTHWVHLSAAAPQAGKPPSATAGGRAGPLEGVLGSQRSLLVLVCAEELVLAVQLEAYDEEMHDQLAAQVEGHAAISLLQHVAATLGPHLDHACHQSRLVQAMAGVAPADGSVHHPPSPQRVRTLPAGNGNHAAQAAAVAIPAGGAAAGAAHPQHGPGAGGPEASRTSAAPGQQVHWAQGVPDTTSGASATAVNCHNAHHEGAPTGWSPDSISSQGGARTAHGRSLGTSHDLTSPASSSDKRHAGIPASEPAKEQLPPPHARGNTAGTPHKLRPAAALASPFKLLQPHRPHLSSAAGLGPGGGAGTDPGTSRGHVQAGARGGGGEQDAVASGPGRPGGGEGEWLVRKGKGVLKEGHRTRERERPAGPGPGEMQSVVLLVNPASGRVHLMAGDLPLAPPGLLCPQPPGGPPPSPPALSHAAGPSAASTAEGGAPGSSQPRSGGAEAAASAWDGWLAERHACLAAVWEGVAEAQARFHASGGKPQAAPPRHSRLCMSLGQIEQLSALKAPREGGQRLGSTDSAPWQYHPELAGLASVQQVSLQLRPAAGAALDRGDWLLTCHLVSTGALPEGELQLMVVHPQHANEQELLDWANSELARDPHRGGW